MPDDPRTHQRITMLLVVLVVVWQFALPAVQLTRERPARFGWQMFSSAASPPTYWLVAADGSERELSVFDYVAVPRAEIRLDERLARHIGSLHPEVIAIRWRLAGSEQIKEIRCDR